MDFVLLQLEVQFLYYKNKYIILWLPTSIMSLKSVWQ